MVKGLFFPNETYLFFFEKAEKSEIQKNVEEG